MYLRYRTAAVRVGHLQAGELRRAERIIRADGVEHVISIRGADHSK